MGGVGEATQGPQACDTCHLHVWLPLLQVSQAKIFEENILGGETNNSFERKKKNIIKGKEMRNKGCVEKEEEKRKKKNQSCPNFFTVFRWSKFGNLGIKVGLLDVSYE